MNAMENSQFTHIPLLPFPSPLLHYIAHRFLWSNSFAFLPSESDSTSRSVVIGSRCRLSDHRRAGDPALLCVLSVCAILEGGGVGLIVQQPPLPPCPSSAHTDTRSSLPHTGSEAFPPFRRQ